ncbi:unnamed protein product [Rhizophagus irregularis]|nr:unnamed protein product [Rhizophagus irregularis]
MHANILEVLISELYGYHCLKRILFDFNLIKHIEQVELLKAVDIVADLVEKCPEHVNNLSLSEGFSVYKACTALLRTLRDYESVDNKEQHWHRRQTVGKNSLFPLSIKDEQHLTLLGMKMPQKLSDLPHFSRALEQRKIDSFENLMELFPCISCQRQALNYVFPDEYILEDESAPSRCFHLPFEFNEDDKLGPWDILLSEDAIKDLQHLESRPDVIRLIMQKLGQISSGAWDRHKLRCNAMQTSAIPVYEIVLPDNGLKILWQIDYGFTIRSNSLTQLVRIWAVTDNKEQIDQVLNDLSIVHQVYTSKQRHWCMEQRAKNNLVLPKILGDGEDTGSSEDRVYASRTEDELLMIHKKLVTNKFVPLSTNLYKSLVLGGLRFTFQVSKREYEIINCPTSAIVVGRSGTGKTTCIVFRQIASYLNSQIYENPSLCGNNRNFYKRQIFITVSYNLRHHVKKYFDRLLESAELAGKQITKAEFRKYREKKERGECVSTLTMREERDEEKELKEIPNTFNYLQLTDDKFPLFITFDKFFEMLQGTYGIKNQDFIIQKKLNADNIDLYDKDKERFNRITKDTEEIFVSYDRFRKKYWPSLNDYSKKKFDCELVYSEFSIIKGTNPEVDFLSREDYIDVSIKKYPAFCYNRDEIYDLFQHYEKMKAQRHEYDSMDRTLAIFRRAKKKALGSLHIHEVYIDECQDNHIMDLALILKVFDRTSSIFFAGDIAQCIAKGSSFRFQDLQALMYQWELTRKNDNILKPKLFDLNINYRSHNGILKLAASVVKLIQHLFPNSIDQLSSERSEVDGPLPIIVNEFKEEYFNILNNRPNELKFTYDICREMKFKKRSSLIEFGADQVIIVRNEEVKSRVMKLVDKGAMVLTVLDAKGMEFNDVLLYNFFTDSPACRKWRVILSAVKKKSERVPVFSHEKHYILSSELKHLYVAVTRARRNIWICDENTEYSLPIRVYWERCEEDREEDQEEDRVDQEEEVREEEDWEEYREEDRKKDQRLFRVKTISNLGQAKTFFSNLAKKSSPDEWDQKGRDYFEKQQYEQAIFGFTKSGNEKDRKLAYAYRLRQIARDSRDDDFNEDTIKSNFTNAARAFQECSRPDEAAKCYQKIGMYKDAGDIYAEDKNFESAAYSYLKAYMYLEAGKYFEKVEKYDDAAFAYKDGDLEIAAKFILSYKQEIKNRTFRHVARHIKNSYHSVAISDGKFDKAVDMYKILIDDNNDDDIDETLELILYICRIDMLKETIIYITSPSTLQKYLSKAKEFIMEFESRLISKSEKWNNLIEEFNLYSAYLDKDFNKVYEYIQFFRHRKELATEFHAVNIWLQILPQSSGIQSKHHYERLKNLQWMCELVFSFINIINNKKRNQIKKNFEDIFCIREVINLQKRQISFGNPLLNLVDKPFKSMIEISEENRNDQHIYDAIDVHRSILKCLVPRIFKHIQNADQKGRNIPDISYQLCYKFTSCEKSGCRRHHVKPTPSILYQRLMFSRLQYTVMIMFDDVLEKYLNYKQIKKIRNLQKWWTERLIKIHTRYQSPQVSCPEATYIKFPERETLIYPARKTWLFNFKDINNFEVILEYMFVFQWLQDRRSINKFNWKVSKTKILSHSNNLPIGFEYYKGHNKAIPVGNRLSSFFFHLYLNNVISAISNIKIFIQYAIDNAQLVNLVTSDAFGNLISLIEFTISLVFTIKPGYCDFCIPRAFLINYFEEFTAEPLIPDDQHNYDREKYLDMINNSFDQVQKLLNLLICEEQVYLSIILRLIRLLILVSLNETKLATKVIILFKNLNRKVFSAKIKKYLEKESLEQLTNVLCNDLKETGCDYLVIVYHYAKYTEVLSKFSRIEKNSFKKLRYKSTKEFHSALQQIKSPVNNQENVTTVNKLQVWYCKIRRSQKAIRKIQGWFRRVIKIRKIQAWFHKLEAVKKIQSWIRRVYKRVKSRQPGYDPTPNKIYNDMVVFCKSIAKEVNKKSVCVYNILLRGQTVDIVVKLLRLYKRMKAFINKCSPDSNKSNRRLELEDELRNHHYKEVEQALKSLSITENSAQHKEVNIKWLKKELQQAEDIIDQFQNWVDEYEDEVNSNKIFQQKEF